MLTDQLPEIVISAIHRWRAGAIDTEKLAECNESSVAGRQILVTGGASGIGEACCRRLASGGAHVVIADFNDALGKNLEQELHGRGLSAKFIFVDVIAWDSQIQLFQKALQFFPGGVLDALITCAGVKGATDWDLTPATNDATLNLEQIATLPRPSTSCIDVNLLGTMFSVQLAVKYCMGLSADKPVGIQSSAKSIVLVGSMAGFRFLPNKPDYTAAKYGTRGLFKCLRQELPKLGVRLNLLAPYFIATPMTAPALKTLESQDVKLGDIEDVVQAVLRMTLDADMNGRAICVNSDGLRDLGDDIGGDEGARAMLEMYTSGSIKPY